MDIHPSKYHAAHHAEQFISSCCTMLVKVQPKFCNICSENQQENADFQLFLEIHVLVGFVDKGFVMDGRVHALLYKILIWIVHKKYRYI